MKSLIARLVLATLFLASPAYAKEKNKNAEPKKDKKAEAEPAKPAKVRSAENRQGKTATVLAEIGLIDVLHSGSGIQAGYFLSPNMLLEADYFSASFSFLGSGSEVTLMTGRMKYFIGNSFYAQGGLGMRSITMKDEFGSFIGTSQDDSSEFHGSSLVGEVGIGNRWQWSGFTLGCDWVGYVQPLAELGSSEKFGSDASDETKTAERADFEEAQQKGNLMLVRFALGWSF